MTLLVPPLTNLVSSSELSIYIHWPFCLSKCPYCDFNSHVANQIDHDRWLSCYIRELEYFIPTLSSKSIKSIFFGGGTPSLMKPKIIEKIIEKIASISSLQHNAEITLEANPTSFEIEKFKAFKQAGINRISIGVQALNNKDLAGLGREHDMNQALDAITSAANIFQNTSFDLIYARSGQDLKQWQKELKFASNYVFNHISLYQLTIEKGTPFYKLFNEGKLMLPDNNDAAAMYEWTTEYLAKLGYARYEISNYAKPNSESIHNLCYWNYESYLGIGPGAHSRLIADKAYSMMMWHSPNKWLDVVESHGCGVQLFSELKKEESVTEALMMGLRLASGVKLINFDKLANREYVFRMLNEETMQFYQDLGFLSYSTEHIRLTDKGLILHSYILSRILK